MPRHLSIGLMLSALHVASCGGQDEVPSRSLLSPIALDRHAVWLDQENDEALALDIGGAAEPVLDAFELPGQPHFALRRHGANELLVLLYDEDEDTGKLAAIGPGGVERVYDLGTQFDTIKQSDDGAHAIVYFSPNGANNRDANLLFNPNEIAIVDLNASGSDAVVQRTLRSLGAAPQRIEFSPTMDIAGEQRRLAVVFFRSEVALIDLNHQDRPEYTIELSRGANLQLSQIRFSVKDQKIYLLAHGSNDVYVLRLLPAGSNRANDFEPSLNQLGTDSSPEDMAIFESDGAGRLLVASSSSAQVVDASSSRVTQIPLVNAANRILLFEGSSPFDDAIQWRALLYSVGSGGLTFLDLEEIEERTTRNREELSVSSVSSLVPLDDNLVLLNHNGGSLSILDLQQRTAAPIHATLQLADAVPNLEVGRLWVAPPGQSTLGFIDLDNLHPGQVRLDRPISDLLLFGLGKQPRVVVTHPDAGGAVTILSASEPTNAGQAITLEGFFHAGVLDR
jgi:hypothetical protein